MQWAQITSMLAKLNVLVPADRTNQLLLFIVSTIDLMLALLPSLATCPILSVLCQCGMYSVDTFVLSASTFLRSIFSTPIISI